MMNDLIAALGSLGLFVALGMYLYVGVAIVRAERQTGTGWGIAVTKAATWPVTIWHTIRKLYLTTPRDFE